MNRLLRLNAARFLALAATCIAAYLWSQAASGAAGCDALGEFDCDAALTSRWATWFGVAVSIVGAGSYFALFVGSCLIGRGPGLDALGWRMVEVVVPAAIGAAAWFLGLQAFGASPVCPFCVATHACGVAGALLLLLERRSAADSDRGAPMVGLGVAGTPQAPSSKVNPPPGLGAPTLLGVLAVVALVVGQVVAPPELETIDADELTFALATSADEEAGPPTSKPLADKTPQEDGAAKATETALPTRPRSGSREIALLKGKLVIDTYEHPVLGSPDAEHIVVELMDYACPHCHEFADMLDEARPRYGDQLGIVVLPVPTELLCNKYVKKVRPRARGDCKVSRVALALATTAPDAFTPLHEWLLDQDELPSWGTALSRARDLGGDRVEDAYISPQVKQRVQANIEIYGAIARAGASALPCQILKDTVVPGKPATVEQLCEVWEDQLGIAPLTSL